MDRFQRAEWNANGKLQVMDVYTAPERANARELA
jgi:hypothetical protein